MRLPRAMKRQALVAVAVLAVTAGCTRGLPEPPPARLDDLRREHAALHERLEGVLGRDPLAARVFEARGDVVLGIKTSFVTEIVSELSHRYFDEVVLDLATVRAGANGSIRRDTFIGRVKVGDWQVETRVLGLRGRLHAGHPNLEFQGESIAVEVPVEVRPARGKVALAFAWDSSGIVNVVCNDFEVHRVLEGRVLPQSHTLEGRVTLTGGDRFLTATPVFDRRTVPLRVDLTAESWRAVEEELAAQDTLGKCGLIVKPDKVVAELRGLAARGIPIRLPDVLFRSASLPARLEERVTLANRAIDVIVRSSSLVHASDALWSTVAVATDPPTPR